MHTTSDKLSLYLALLLVIISKRYSNPQNAVKLLRNSSALETGHSQLLTGTQKQSQSLFMENKKKGKNALARYRFMTLPLLPTRFLPQVLDKKWPNLLLFG